MLRPSPLVLISSRLTIFLPIRRHFFSFPRIPSASQSPQTVSLARTLPHPPRLLYSVVSDVDSYSAFVPYCVTSIVTHRDPVTQQPAKATLRVGWKAFDESFESVLTCVEGASVIAESHKHSLFKTLYTRWQIFPHPQRTDRGRVVLELKFEFANPLYNAVSASFAPAVAQIMIEAFEKRIADVALAEADATTWKQIKARSQK
ncbi:dehydrase and lipid transport-domain-containing protein [Limtongia smithiae]|uniref:dehydrase and lipid transport-domain-containing protein n=1 Tax=Limtongia smithiae TaxID=1125753 RepID=UPI0034CF2B5B